MDVDEALPSAFPRRFAVLRSAGPDEVGATVSRLLTAHRGMPVGGRKVVAGDVSLIHVRHDGAELRVRFTEMVSYYDVHLPVAGGNLVECAGDEAVLGRRGHLSGDAGEDASQ